jgi:hypothetical protein
MMQTMPIWKGWTATTGARTWDEWCAQQQGALRNQQRQDVPFSERELACLSFMRWLYQAGRLDPREHDTH